MRVRAWLIAPLPATALGIAAASRHGVAVAAFLPNLVALGLGSVAAIVAIVLGARRLEAARWAMRWLPLAVLVAISTTLVMPDLDGVRRWLSLGPLRINASAASLPWLLAGMVSPESAVRARAVGLACGVQLVHLAQPDAGQATALAIGVLPLLVGGTVVGRRMGIACAGALLVIAAVAWTRSDVLPAVAHVEGILGLVGELGSWWPAAAGAATLCLLAPAMVAMREHDPVTIRLAAGLALYGCTTFGVSVLGRFPVPVFGAGAGPVLGWYAMIGVLGIRSMARHEASVSH